MAALTGPRAETWTWAALSTGAGDGIPEQPRGQLDGVTAGHLDWSIFNTIRTSGNLTWSGPDASSMPNWSQIRVAPTYTALTPDGVVTWQMGVYLPAAPTLKFTPTGLEVNVELYDKLLILDQSKVTESYTVAAGSVVTAAAAAVVAGAALYAPTTAVVASSQTLLTSMVWPAGTTRLAIVNDLLAAINYFSLWVDRYGTFQITPYIPPEQRQVQWQFADDNSSIYTPDFDNEQDTFNIPNQVVMVSASDGTSVALTATANDYTSPNGYTAKGWWNTYFEDNVQTTSQATLNATAARKLVDLSTAQNTLNINHAHLPLDLNDAIMFTNSVAGISTTVASIQSMSLDTVPGSLTQMKILVVS